MSLRDTLIVLACLVVIAAGFYAFQIIVLLIVGLVIYYGLPTIRKFISRRPTWR